MFGTNLNSVLGLGVSVFLRDDFTRNSQKVLNSFNTLNSGVQKKIKNQLSQIQLLSGGVALAGIGVMRGMAGAARETALFEESLYKTKAIADISIPEMERLKNLAISMSTKFPYAAAGISDAFLELSKAGIAAKDMQKMTSAVLAFATAADIAVGGEEGATNMLLNIMAGYKVRIQDAMLVSDMISKASNITTVAPSQIYESLKYSQDTLHNFNIGLAESLALISAMAQSGIKGSRAGIALQNMYTQLAKALGPKQTKGDKMAFQMLGLNKNDLVDVNGNLKDTANMLALIQMRMKGLGDVKKAFVMDQLFGVRGGRGASDIMGFLNARDVKGMPAKTLAEILKATKYQSAGSAMKIVDTRMQSPEQKLQSWNKGLFAFKVALSDNIFPIVIPIIYGLGKVLKKFGEFMRTPFGKVLTIFAAANIMIFTFAAGLAAITASLAYLRLTSGVTKFWGLGGIISIFQMIFSNLFGKFAMFNSAGRIINPLGRFMPLWWTGMKNAVPWLGRIVALLGPWGKGLIAIAASLTLLYNVSDGIKKAIDSTFRWIWNVVKTMAMSMKYAFNLIRSTNPFDTMSFGGANATMQKDYNDIWNPDRNKVKNSVGRPPVRVTNSQGQSQDLMKMFEKMMSENKQPVTVNLYTDGKKTLTKYINSAQERDVYHTGVK